MVDHKLGIGDSSATEDNDAGNVDDAPEIERFPYVVTSEAGLFKNGNQYNQGDTVELDTKTAANFIASGDVEEAEGTTYPRDEDVQDEEVPA